MSCLAANNRYMSSPFRCLHFFGQANNFHISFPEFLAKTAFSHLSVGKFRSLVGNFGSSEVADGFLEVDSRLSEVASSFLEVASRSLEVASELSKVASGSLEVADGWSGGNYFTPLFTVHTIVYQLVTSFHSFFKPFTVQHQPLVALHRLKPMRSRFSC